jgi:hypothetical protein
MPHAAAEAVGHARPSGWLAQATLPASVWQYEDTYIGMRHPQRMQPPKPCETERMA